MSPGCPRLQDYHWDPVPLARSTCYAQVRAVLLALSYNPHPPPQAFTTFTYGEESKNTWTSHRFKCDDLPRGVVSIYGKLSHDSQAPPHSEPQVKALVRIRTPLLTERAGKMSRLRSGALGSISLVCGIPLIRLRGM